MDEEAFLSIKDKLKEESLVTYSWLQTKFNIDAEKCQNVLQSYLNSHDDALASFLNFSTQNDINFSLNISKCKTQNSVIMCLRSKQSDELNFQQFLAASNELEPRRLNIISDNAILLSPPTLSPVIESEKAVKTEPKSGSSKLINNFFKTSTSSEKVPEKDLKTKKNDDSKDVKTEDKCEKSTKTISSNNFFIKNESRTKSDAKQTAKLDVNNKVIKNDISFTKSKSPSPDIPVRPLEISKPKSGKSKLFENFKNEPLKQSVKRKRLVISSDEDSPVEDVRNILVEDSFEEKGKKEEVKQLKKTTTLKAKPSKLIKINAEINVDKDHKLSTENTLQSKKVSMKKIEKTYQDEDGFLVVEKVSVPVAPESDNVPSNQHVFQQPSKAQHTDKNTSKTLKQNLPTAKNKQTSIMSFFQKK